ncbi:3488_t:CDS:2 [Paraglomus brasilianum]|uniref:3488_t:CDS:1 n=1 Tax=Paraglomus brasilianum TaxID=144538 RepID=A0A9N9AKP6_9GLOM|nr:3488_t:CDS:2 [Paraglomus brasilianum]
MGKYNKLQGLKRNLFTQIFYFIDIFHSVVGQFLPAGNLELEEEEIFNLAFFYSSTIQEQYRRIYGGNENLVRANDVFFAVHALILSCITFGQTFLYKKNRNQRLSAFAISLTFITFLGILSMYLKVASGLSEWIDLLYFISYIKLGLSLIKYIPQAYINYKRKSTVGWSIHNIALDFTGGTLSLLQLILDAYLADDWSGISGDPVKFGLGSVSLTFDLLFMGQHYILYRDRNDYSNDEDKKELRDYNA